MGSKSLAIYPICFPGLHDDEGLPLSGGKAYFYDAGTTTPKDVYTDRDKTSIASQPVVLDTYGRAEIYADGLYHIVITDADDTTIYDLDDMEFISREGGSLDDTEIGLVIPADAAFLDVDAETVDVSSSLLFKSETVTDRQVLHDQTINAAVTVLDWVWRDTDDEWIKANGTTECQGLYWKNTAGDKIVLVSGLATGFTGLVSGSVYYLANDGTLTTDSDSSTNKIKVGVAVSTTALLVSSMGSTGRGYELRETDLDVLLAFCSAKKFGAHAGIFVGNTFVRDGIAMAFERPDDLVLTVGGAGYTPSATTITLSNTSNYSFQYPLIATIYNAGASEAGEDIVLISDNGSGVYTMAAALSGSYAASSSYVRIHAGTVNNMRGTYLSGANATSYPAKNANFHEEYMLREEAINADLLAAGVFTPGAIFNVSSFSSATETVLSNTTGVDLHGLFANGGKAVIFKAYKKGDKILNPYSEALTSNFQILNITSSSGSGNITIQHDACDVYGSSEQGETQQSSSVWYVIPLNLTLKYFVGEIDDEPSYSSIVPTIFKCLKILSFSFSDNFARTDGAPGNNWTVTLDQNNGGTSQITSGEYVTTMGSSYTGARLKRNLEDWSITNGKLYELTAKIHFSLGSANQAIVKAFHFGSADVALTNGSYYYIPVSNSGVGIAFEYSNSGSSVQAIKVFDGATEKSSASFTFAANTYYQIRIRVDMYSVKAKIWADGSSEPGAWTLEYSSATPFTNSGTYLQINDTLTNTVGAGAVYKLDDLVVKTETTKCLIAGVAADQNGWKLNFNTFLHRDDATNDISDIVEAVASFKF